MTRTTLFSISVGLLLSLVAAPAHAQITITITDLTTGTQVGSATGDATQATFFRFLGGMTLESSFSNNDSTGATSNTGELGSMFTYTPTNTDKIEVVVTENTPFRVPSSANLNVQNLATVSSPTLGFNGSVQVNNGPAIAPVSTLNLSSSGLAANSSTGYTLKQTFDVMPITVGQLTTVSLTTTVTPAVSSAAVPEPSSLVLTALTALGVGGAGWRTRRRVRSA